MEEFEKAKTSNSFFIPPDPSVKTFYHKGS